MKFNMGKIKYIIIKTYYYQLIFYWNKKDKIWTDDVKLYLTKTLY